MANFKNLTLHNSSNYPSGFASFEVLGATVLDNSLDSRFLASEAVWTTINTNVTESFSPHNTIQLDGPNYAYEYESVNPAPLDYIFDVEFNAECALQNLTVDPIKVGFKFTSNLSVYICFTDTRTYGELFINDGGDYINQTVEFDWDSQDIELRLVFNNHNTLALFARQDDVWMPIIERNNFIGPDAGGSYVFGPYVEGVGTNQGTVTFKKWLHHPICDGIFDIRYNGGALCESSNASRGIARFHLMASAPGAKTASIIGQDFSNTVESVDGDFAILVNKNVRGDANILVGLAEKYYTDADLYYACPAFGIADSQARGSAEIINECFDDGSPLEDERSDIVFASSGLVDSLDRSKNAKFNLELDGKLYGQDFDFKKIHTNDANFRPASSRNWRTLRTLVLRDGRRLYYGVIEDNRTAQEVFFNWKIDATDTDVGYALYSMDDPVNPIDQARFEDGVNTYNVLTDGLQQYYLPRGRYFFQCSKIFTDSTHEISVDLGTLGYTAVKYIDDNPEVSNYTNVKIYFENRESWGYLAYLVYDPATGQTSDTYIVADADVRTDTESISAIELEDEIALIFSEIDISAGLQDSKTNRLTYRIINKTDYTYSDKRYIYLPKLYGRGTTIHAFDLASIGNSINLFVSFETYEQGFFIQDEQTTVPDSKVLAVRNWGPFIHRGLDVFFFSKDSIGWNRETTVLSDYTSTSIQLKSLETLYSGSTNGNFGDRFFEWTIADAPIPLWPDVTPLPPSFTNIQNRQGYLSADMIRAEADQEAGIIVLSILDMHWRKPCVFIGNILNFKEVCIPAFFNLNYQSDKRQAAWLNSFSSCLHSDGFIYSLASTLAYDKSAGDISQLIPCELAVISPEMYFSDRQLYCIRNPTSTERGIFSGADIYKGEYYTSIIPFMSELPSFDTPDIEKWNGMSYDTLDTPELPYQDMRTSVSIVRDKNFLIGVQVKDRYKYPLIFQTCYSNLPQETICVEYFPPEAFNSAVVDKTGQVSFVDDSWRIQDSTAESYIRRRLNYNNMIRDFQVKDDLGHRVVATIKNSPTDLPMDDFYIEANFITGKTLGQLLTPQLDFKRARARFVINDGQATAEYYDIDVGDWVAVESFALSNDVIYDFHIYLQNYDFDRTSTLADYDVDAKLGRFIWFIKTNKELNGSAYNGFINECLFKTQKTEVILDNAYTTEESTVKLYFAGNGASNKNNYVYVYGFGWGLIRNEDFPKEFESTSKGGQPVFEYTTITKIGKTWRLWDDRDLFNKGIDDSIYPVRQAAGFFDNVSMSFYAGNGFKASVTGSTLPRDRHYIQRQLTSDVNSISAKMLHGVWVAKEPTEDVYVWADANDSGMDYFDADTFVVLGNNFYNYDIVYKDDLEDPWLTAIEVRPDVLKIDQPTLSNLLNKKLLASDDVLFQQGMLQDDPIRFFQNGGLNASADSLKDSGLYIDSSIAANTSAVRVFNERYVKKTFRIIRARYIGLRIRQQSIQEGYIKLGTFDFGIMSNYPVNMERDIGSLIRTDAQADLKYIEDNQGYSFKVRRIGRSFIFNYYAVTAADFVRFMSMIDEVDVRRRPVFVIYDWLRDPSNVYLALGGNVNNEVVTDEDETYYKMSITFNGV